MVSLEVSAPGHLPASPLSCLPLPSLSSLPSRCLPKPSSRGDRASRLLVYGALAVGAFVVALGPVADGDIYWHLAAGREMVLRHALLRTDPFTLSAAGRPWVDVHWLFQLGAYAIYSASGLLGLTVVKAALVALAAVGATRVAERAGGGAGARTVCAVALLGALFLARHLLPIRPVIVTLLFLTLFLSVLERARVAWESDAPLPRRALLLLLPAAQIVWSNCQGLSALGPALVLAYLLAEIARASGPRRRLPDARPLALSLALCLVAGVVTPYGLAGARLPLRLFLRLVPGAANVFSAAVAENVPPFVLQHTAPDQVGPFRWVLVIVAILAIALVVTRSRVHLAHGLVLAAFAGLALMANRNVLLFYWVAAPILAIAIGEAIARRPRHETRAPVPARGFWFGIPALALLGELVLVGWAAAREAPAGTPTPFHFPVESVHRLADLRFTGPVFAPDQHGGYLELMLPGAVPYIDTRLVLHTGQEYAAYLALFADPRRFDGLAAKEAFGAVILTTAYPDSYLGLISHLTEDPAWRLTYTDGYEVLFTRARAQARGPDAAPGLRLSERGTIDAISAELVRRFQARPEILAAARLHLARLLIVVGELPGAAHVLAGLDARPAVQLRARAELAGGELGAAESLARILVESDARDVHSLTLLGEIAAARGAPARAADWLRRSLAIDPYDAEALALLERLEHPTAAAGN